MAGAAITPPRAEAASVEGDRVGEVSDGFHWSYITADGGRGKGELEGAKDPMGVLYVSWK